MVARIIMNIPARLHRKFKEIEQRFSNYRRLHSYYRSLKVKLKPHLSPLPSQPDFHQIQEILERILTQNILPFWYPQMIDLEEGGYRLNHDLKGKWKGRKYKRLVTQTRTVWFFSRLFKSKYGTKEHLEAAKHGYEFLRDYMLDKEFGGFYWEVDPSGNLATKPDKHLYGQAFALYGLSEYAITCGDSSALNLAKQLFNILEEYAYDRQYGGYREFFQRDWTAIPPDQKNYLGVFPTIKLLNTHLHLMEAMKIYYLATKDAIARERLIELIFIQSNTVLRKTVGACTDQYQQDWTPIDGSDVEYISYGHDVENVWLLMEACQTVGISNYLFIDLYKTLFNYSIQYGFDRNQGGFYDTGYYNSPPNSLVKRWWVQAESLIAALRMYQLTKEDLYYHCFCQTLDWIVKYQADWENGDWHNDILANGQPWGDKAGSWKSPYHNGRAILECLELIPSLVT